MDIYKVSGTLNRNYLGGISYDHMIYEDFSELKILFEFEKREPESIDRIMIEKIEQSWLKNFEALPSENQLKLIIENLKSEINCSVYMDNQFIGSAHRDELHKEIIIGKNNSSLGFNLYSGKKGLLTIKLNIISILNNNTPYRLSVEVI